MAKVIPQQGNFMIPWGSETVRPGHPTTARGLARAAVATLPAITAGLVVLVEATLNLALALRMDSIHFRVLAPLFSAAVVNMESQVTVLVPMLSKITPHGGPSYGAMVYKVNRYGVETRKSQHVTLAQSALLSPLGQQEVQERIAGLIQDVIRTIMYEIQAAIIAAARGYWREMYYAGLDYYRPLTQTPMYGSDIRTELREMMRQHYACMSKPDGSVFQAVDHARTIIGDRTGAEADIICAGTGVFASLATSVTQLWYYYVGDEGQIFRNLGTAALKAYQGLAVVTMLSLHPDGLADPSQSFVQISEIGEVYGAYPPSMIGVRFNPLMRAIKVFNERTGGEVLWKLSDAVAESRIFNPDTDDYSDELKSFLNATVVADAAAKSDIRGHVNPESISIFMYEDDRGVRDLAHYYGQISDPCLKNAEYLGHFAKSVLDTTSLTDAEIALLIGAINAGGVYLQEIAEVPPHDDIARAIPNNGRADAWGSITYDLGAVPLLDRRFGKANGVGIKSLAYGPDPDVRAKAFYEAATNLARILASAMPSSLVLNKEFNAVPWADRTKVTDAVNLIDLIAGPSLPIYLGTTAQVQREMSQALQDAIGTGDVTRIANELNNAGGNLLYPREAAERLDHALFQLMERNGAAIPVAVPIMRANSVDGSIRALVLEIVRGTGEPGMLALAGRRTRRGGQDAYKADLVLLLNAVNAQANVQAAALAAAAYISQNAWDTKYLEREVPYAVLFAELAPYTSAQAAVAQAGVAAAQGGVTQLPLTVYSERLATTAPQGISWGSSGTPGAVYTGGAQLDYGMAGIGSSLYATQLLQNLSGSIAAAETTAGFRGTKRPAAVLDSDDEETVAPAPKKMRFGEGMSVGVRFSASVAADTAAQAARGPAPGVAPPPPRFTRVPVGVAGLDNFGMRESYDAIQHLPTFTKVMATVLFFLPITRKSTLALCTFADPPFSAAFFRPHITHETSSLVVMKAGPGTARTHYTETEVSSVTNGHEQTETLTAYWSSGVFVAHPENTFVINDAYLVKYLAGCEGAPCKGYDARARESNGGDYYATLMQRDHRIVGPICMSGGPLDEEVAQDLAPSYDGAMLLSKAWGFAEMRAVRMEEGFGYPRCNTICDEGTTLRFNAENKTGGFTSVVPSQSALGDALPNSGIHKVRGAKMTLEDWRHGQGHPPVLAVK